MTNEHLIIEKLDAHDRWLERRYWCIERWGENDDIWDWDPLQGVFVFTNPDDELIFKLVWG